MNWLGCVLCCMFMMFKLRFDLGFVVIIRLLMCCVLWWLCWSVGLVLNRLWLC